MNPRAAPPTRSRSRESANKRATSRSSSAASASTSRFPAMGCERTPGRPRIDHQIDLDVPAATVHEADLRQARGTERASSALAAGPSGAGDHRRALYAGAVSRHHAIAAVGRRRLRRPPGALRSLVGQALRAPCPRRRRPPRSSRPIAPGQHPRRRPHHRSARRPAGGAARRSTRSPP